MGKKTKYSEAYSIWQCTIILRFLREQNDFDFDVLKRFAVCLLKLEIRLSRLSNFSPAFFEVRGGINRNLKYKKS